MTSPLVRVLVVILLLKFSLAKNEKTCGYYWKIYDGNTPNDAVKGGKDAEGNTLYIALVNLKLVHELLPGMIIPSKKSALVTSYALAFYVKNDFHNEVKILCSSDKQGFEWVPTTSQGLNSLTGRNLVPGGNVLGQNLNIGRVRHGGGDVVGKVFPHSFVFQGLYIPSGGTHIQYLTFDVLAYNCTNTKREEKKEEEKTTTEKKSDIDQAIDDIFNGL